MRVRNKADVGQLCGNPVGLVLHAELDQLTERVELGSTAEPHLSVVCFHIVIHVFVALWLGWSGVEVFQLGMLFGRTHVHVREGSKTPVMIIRLSMTTTLKTDFLVLHLIEDVANTEKTRFRKCKTGYN